MTVCATGIMSLVILFFCPTCSNGLYFRKDIISSSYSKSNIISSAFPNQQNKIRSFIARVQKKDAMPLPLMQFSSYSSFPISSPEFDKDKHILASKSVVQVVANILKYNWEKPWEASSDIISSGTAFWTEVGGKNYFVTNAHVVHNSISTIIKVPKLGSRQFRVNVVGICIEKDVALLSLVEPESFPVHMEPLVWGNSDHYEQGSAAIGIGFPLGQAGLKITSGIVSGFEHINDRYYIQVTTPINPGNSGGPLLNGIGEVMGINSAAIPSAANVGYAIPSQNLLPVLESCAPNAKETKINKSENKSNVPIFIKGDQTLNYSLHKRIFAQLDPPVTQKVSNLLPASVLHKFPTYGIKLSSTTSELIEYMKAPASGIFVSNVSAGFFNDAGILEGDIILDFDGWKLDNYGHTDVSPSQRLNIFDLGERVKNGSTINITIWRNGQKLNKSAIFKYDEIEEDQIKFIEEPARENIEYEVFGGMVLMQLTWNHIAEFADSNYNIAEYVYNPTKVHASRLVISSILYPASTIPDGSVYQGDIISKVNGHPINTLDDFQKFLVPTDAQHPRYCSFTTEDGKILVMDFIDTLIQEFRISQLNGYNITPRLAKIFQEDLVQKEIEKKVQSMVKKKLPGNFFK